MQATPLCGCTTLSREQLKDAIAASRTSTVREAMMALGWQTADGCNVCRPAIRYYIGSLGRQSVSGGDRVSTAALTAAAETEGKRVTAAEGTYAALANGTYAVQPRLYGGVATAEQLRRIADAIDRYHVPLAKLNGEGRLELLGLSEAEAVGVAQSLGGSVAAYSYGRPVASVVTCGGIVYDRGAVRDSIAVGAALERRLERLQLPTTVSAAVSASPFHRAGSLVRDIGIVGVPGGWELYVGGSSGVEVKEAKLLLTEPDERAAVDTAAAVLQLYAEEALYGEPLWQWLDRSGLVAIRERVLDPRSRKALLLRSQYEAEQQMALRGECS
jgi:nitrite reductase (NADH) large subunit